MLPLISGDEPRSCGRTWSSKGGSRVPRFAKAFVIAAAVALTAAPVPARAEGFVVPWFGGTFSRSSEIRDINNGTTSFGGAVGAMGGGLLGFDLDVGFTPNFFGEKAAIG